MQKQHSWTHGLNSTSHGEPKRLTISNQIQSRIKPVLFSVLAWQSHSWFGRSNFVQCGGTHMLCKFLRKFPRKRILDWSPCWRWQNYLISNKATKVPVYNEELEQNWKLLSSFNIATTVSVVCSLGFFLAFKHISRFKTKFLMFMSVHIPNLKVWGFERLEGLKIHVLACTALERNWQIYDNVWSFTVTSSWIFIQIETPRFFKGPILPEVILC